MNKLDKLTPEEATSVLNGIVDALTPYVDETADNAEETTDSEETTEAPAEKPAETSTTKADKNVMHQPILIIKDRKEAVHQEVASGDSAKSYLKTDKAVAAWGKALIDSKGDARAWRENFRRIAKADGVDFGENISIAPEAVVNAIAEQLRDEDSLFSHVNRTGLAFEVVAIPTSEDGGRGHVRGKSKVEENVTGTTRVLTPADLYKLMRLDHSMVKLNGGLGSSAIVRYVLRELPRKLIETIDKGILLGNIQNDDVDAEGGATTFSALNSIVGDITANGTYGKEYTPVSGDNLRQTVSKAANKVLSGTNRTLISTADYFTDLENATTSGGQLLFPNGINKGEPNINGIRRIITPLWLTSAMMNGLDAIVVDLEAYHTVGDSTPESFTDYDIDVNKYVWEAVACIGGGLAAANAAVGIKSGTSD